VRDINSPQSATVSCAALLWIVLSAGPVTAQDEAKEPPQKFTVNLGDQSVKVLEGESVKLTGSFTNPQLTIKPDPYRVFPYQGLRFQYPRSFSFEADLTGPGEKNWTLSGNDVRIMLFVFDERTTVAEFAEGVISELGKANCKIVDANAKLKLGTIEITGVKLHMTISTHGVTQDIYSIPTPRPKTRLLVFQDSPDENGNRSAEAKGVLETLNKSFQVDGK
jgi:hypothetical protein